VRQVSGRKSVFKISEHKTSDVFQEIVLDESTELALGKGNSVKSQKRRSESPDRTLSHSNVSLRKHGENL